MPNFIYQAKSTKDGSIETGLVEAASESELAHQLAQKNLILISAQVSSKKKKLFPNLNFILNHIPLIEKLLFCRNLSIMIRTGIPLVKALESLRQQTKNKYFAQAINQISQQVQQGKSFSDALSQYPKIFDNLFVAMIKAGEASGRLEEILQTLSKQLERKQKLISRVRGALIYPAVIISLMIVIAIIMMIFVIPKLVSIFKEMHVQLPLVTRLIIQTSNLFVYYWWAIGLLIIVLIIIHFFISKTTLYRLITNKIILHLPIIGSIVKKLNCALIGQTLESLIRSGVPLLKSLEITSNTIGNMYFRQSIIEAKEKVKKGETLSSALINYPNLYPIMTIQMIEVGENTGRTADMLEQIAKFYEGEVNNLTKNLSSIIEPVLLVIIGTAVAIFAISIIQPIYSLVNQI